MGRIKIGKTGKAVALKGEMRIYSASGNEERFETLNSVIIDDREYKIENIRYNKGCAIIKFEGVDDRNGAEAMNNRQVWIEEDDLEELEEGSFYVKDLIGMDVIDFETGEKTGVVTGVLQNTMQDVFEIRTCQGKDIMVPGVTEFIKDIDMEEGTVIIKFIEGLI